MSDVDGQAADSSVPRGNPAKIIAVVVIALLLVFVVVYALSDRMAPMSSHGFVSANIVQIAPRISGEVTKVMVEDDAVVQEGDPLFAIDSRPFELNVRQARAKLVSTVQGVDASAASLVAAQTAVTQARTNLDKVRADTERTLRLEKRRLVSASAADAARAEAADAEARLKTAQANLDSARAELGPKGADNPAILAAQAQLEQAQYDLASTTITAPHYGVVTNLTLSKGQFIGAGNPALTFIDANAAWVTADFRENQLRNMEPGDTAHLLFDALPGEIFEGRVQSVAWGVDPGRSSQGGLILNQPSNRWFEPARRIPVRIELNGGMEHWPRQVRVGGKVDAVVFTSGTGNPIAWLARAFQRIRSWASYLH
jgi:multidrug resistance efflux pump